MKKRLLIVVSASITTALLIFGVNYLLSLHKVSFILDEEVSGVTIYSANDKEMERLSTNGYFLLQEGEYYAVPEGERLSKDKIEFAVKGSDITIGISPDYTKEYLETLLNKEEAAIQAAIAAKYPSLIGSYTLNQGSLYRHGEWFGGLLKPKVDARDQRTPYRVVLHKEDNKWVVIRRPEYILTSSRYKDVPIAILREVNALVGEPDN